MPKYSYKLKNGKTMDLEGDTMPSDEEVEGIAKQNGVELLPIEEPSKFEPKVDTSPSPNVIEPSKDESSLLSKAWKAISEPLTDLPSRIGRSAANFIDQPTPTQNESPIMARLKGFTAGATQGVGDIFSNLTSPINLATAALTGGSSIAEKSGLSSIASGLRGTSKLPSVLMAGHGGMEVVNPESTMGERGRGLMEIAGGLAGMHTPKLNEQVIPNEDILSNIKQPIQNDITINASKWANDPQKAENMKNAMILRLGKITTPTTTPQLKMGTTVVIKSNKATPLNVKKAREQGFEFEGLNDQGDFRFKKTSEPTIQPILESEVGSHRIKLGPSTDVKKSSYIAEVMNFPRTVMASIDMSAPLRQGVGLIHKPEFWKALPDMFKSFGSEEAFNAVQQTIAEKPLFKTRVNPKTGEAMQSFAHDAGLKLTDLNDLSTREEAIMSTWAEKVPGIRASNRAYTAFLNKLRADTFESLVKDGKIFGANAEVDIPAARALADFVNIATGRGSLGKLESSAVALNSTFFAPRLIASRLKMMNPMYYLQATPQVRKEALKSLLAIATVGNTTGQLAKMAGAKVETNPNSADFGKIQFPGGIRIDPYAGFQQYVIAANRILRPEGAKFGQPTNTGVIPVDMMTGFLSAGGGQVKSTTSGNVNRYSEHKFGRDTRLDTAGRFAESKLNPVLSFATGIAQGKDFTGQPFNIPEEVVQRFTPIFLQDLKQLLTESPDLVPGIHKKGLGFENLHPGNLPAAIPAWFGMGVQQY